MPAELFLLLFEWLGIRVFNYKGYRLEICDAPIAMKEDLPRFSHKGTKSFV